MNWRRVIERPAESGRAILHRLRWKVLAFVALIHVLLFLLSVQDRGWSARSEAWGLQALTLLSVSLFLTVLFLAFRRSKASEGLLVFQGFVLAVAAYPQGRNPGVIGLTVAVCIIELSFWLMRAELEVAVSACLFGGMLCFHPLPAFGVDLPDPKPFDLWVLSITGGLTLMVASTIRHALIRTGLQRHELRNLRNSLGSLLETNMDLQNYALEVGERATVVACQRLTRDIHDSVGYTMTNLRMMLEAATDLGGRGDGRLQALLHQAKAEVQNGLQETRQALRAFREIEKVRAEGIRHIHKLVNSFSSATGIEVEVTYGNIPWSFGDEINMVIYRILQESMTNAIRHGRATRIRIYFWITAGRLRITVDDNGIGATDINPGIGFKGMRERLEPLGGLLVLGNGVAGFTVRVEIPWPGE